MTRPKRRFWTDTERDKLRRLFGTMTAAAVAKRLRRSVKAVEQQAFDLGLTASRPRWTEADTQALREHHAAGWSDPEIGAALGHERHTVARHRKQLGLPINRFSAHCRERVGARTREQCAAAGVPSLAAVRRQVFRRYAASNGWPSDLRPRHIHILNALASRGPMTRQGLAEILGLGWHGSRSSLKSSDPEGSYLAHLMARGLIVNLGRIATGKGRGRSCCVYSLTLTTERSPVDGIAG